MVDLAKMYDRTTSTICTIFKQKDAIKNAKPVKGTKILSQLSREEMEKPLLLWVTDKELAGDTGTENTWKGTQHLRRPEEERSIAFRRGSRRYVKGKSRSVGQFQEENCHPSTRW